MPFMLALWSAFWAPVFLFAQDELRRAENGIVNIRSDAPLEIIAAESHALRGIIDPASKAFGFTLRINSFEGFNSEIQQTHFQENYMELKKYPTATFKGKFIEDIPFNVPGSYTVRAKGLLEIHGITKERIIKGILVIDQHQMILQAKFFVPVADHGIAIPKIVMQKIAEEIEVDIQVIFPGAL
jgi:hypothetical protein